MKLSEINPNPNNPRLVKDDRFKKLVASIEAFPEMMELRPMVIDENSVILGGNMRYKALQHLKRKEIPDSWVKRADELTDDQKKEFIIKDNVGFGEHDWDTLANEWDAEELNDWGLELPMFDSNEEKEQKDLSDSLIMEFKLEIETISESEQEQLYNELIERGFACKILTL